MTRPRDPGQGLSPVSQARDVMAFGSDIGRVLSDGRIVGRAEPFAKVFPSSRQVKRVVGLAAWAVLEDIALDARLDDTGRLVAETNVRRIAANLGLGKNAVSRHLGRLREYGFVLHEELRAEDTGRYAVSRYVLDPSACLERFTATPPTPARDRAAAGPSAVVSPHVEQAAPPGSAEFTPTPAERPPRPRKRDTVTVSPSAGHREEGRNRRPVVLGDEGQHPAAAALRGLTALGVTEQVAGRLLGRHGAERVADAVAAVQQREVRNAAGWVVRALRDDWSLPPVAAERRRVAARREQAARDAETVRRVDAAREDARARGDGWAAVVSAAFPDDLLAEAVASVASPPPGLPRRSAPLARAQLVQWAAAVVTSDGGPATAALRHALATGAVAVSPSPADVLPEPPALDGPVPDLTSRLGRLLGTPSTDRTGPNRNDQELEAS